MVQGFCGRIAARVLMVLNKQPKPVGYSHWLADHPFGGMEDMDLAKFNLARKLAVERKRIILACTHFWRTADCIATLCQWLDDTPVEDWPPVKDLRASWQSQGNLGKEEQRGCLSPYLKPNLAWTEGCRLAIWSLARECKNIRRLCMVAIKAHFSSLPSSGTWSCADRVSAVSSLVGGQYRSICSLLGGE